MEATATSDKSIFICCLMSTTDFEMDRLVHRELSYRISCEYWERIRQNARASATPNQPKQTGKATQFQDDARVKEDVLS